MVPLRLSCRAIHWTLHFVHVGYRDYVTRHVSPHLVYCELDQLSRVIRKVSNMWTSIYISDVNNWRANAPPFHSAFCIPSLDFALYLDDEHDIRDVFKRGPPLTFKSYNRGQK